MRGHKMMYGYKGKIAGMIVAGIGVLLMLLEKWMHLLFIPKLNEGQHFNIFLFVTLGGLFTMMFSYEKVEDERVKAIRAKSLMYMVMVTVSATLAFAFTMTLMPSMHPEEFTDFKVSTDDVVELGRLLMFYPAVGMVLYLVLFHIGLYFDQVWDYSDNTEVSFWKNLMINKRYRLLFLLIGLAVIELIFKLIE